MKGRPFLWLNALCWLFVLACQTVPITGREQLSLVSSQQIRAMGVDAHQEAKQSLHSTDDEILHVGRKPT